MSVKYAILALLYEKPRHGYEVKIGFDNLVHKKWSLNPGQVYTTLDRLVRDGLVESPGQDENDRKIYSITLLGIEETHKWLKQPVELSILKDEFHFKWLCARKINFQEEKDMIQKQKELIIKEILQLTHLKKQLKSDNQNSMELLVDGALLHLDADLKWTELMLNKV